MPCVPTVFTCLCAHRPRRGFDMNRAAFLLSPRAHHQANVTSVWLNYVSLGGNASSTWSREGGNAYTVPETFTMVGIARTNKRLVLRLKMLGSSYCEGSRP